VLCDVCGRINADNLTFCQDCGRRLRQNRGVAPTPPNGMPRVELAAAAVEAAPDSSRGSSPSGPPSAGRRARPAAPVFSFGPADHAPGEVPRPSIDDNGPRPDAARPVAAGSPREAAAPARDARPVAAKPSVACAQCGSPNPPEYRFCVACGSSMRRPEAGTGVSPARAEAGAGVSPAPAAPRPAEGRDVRRDPPRPDPPRPDGGDQIIGAPVVDIASGAVVPAKLVTCTRCHGQSLGGTRFCKYCGASLVDEPTPSGRRPAIPPEPTPSQPQGAAPVPQAAPSQPFAAPRPAPPALPTPAPVRTEDASVALPSNGVPGPAGPGPAVAQPPPLPRRAEPIGRVPLGPMGKQPPPMPGKPADPPRPGGFAPPRPHLGEPGARTEVSELAGSPIPAEPLALPPPRVVPGRWKGGRLVVIVEDGTEGRSFSLAEGQLDIGRTDGDIILEDDPYVSPRHARLRRLDGSWVVRDLDSTNHVYVRLRRPHLLKDGDLLLLGLEVLQFQTVSDGERGLGHAIQHGTFLFGSPATPRRARLCQRTVEGVIRDVYHVFRDETVIGREMGDIVFTADPFLSRRHAAIRRNPVSSEFSLVDLDSSNGTYVAIRGEVGITDGDFLRIGQHLFRVDLG
jgi:pSer/pThr/pTyr-binding forkhead associated (FHA) protein